MAAGVDEAGKVLVVNKPVIAQLIAARHVLEFAGLGLFSTIGICVVNHGCSKIAREITRGLYTVAYDLVIHTPEFIYL